MGVFLVEGIWDSEEGEIPLKKIPGINTELKITQATGCGKTQGFMDTIL